jgi:hypothetical protein
VQKVLFMHFAHKNFEYFLYGLNAAESPQRDFMSFVTRIQFTQPKLFPGAAGC